MITKNAARRLLFITVACVALFLISSEYAYTQRGYLAIGGEYVFCLIPALAVEYERMRGGE